MSQNTIAHDCKTTVLTVASSAVRRSDALPAWVKRKTGSSDYDLLTVPNFLWVNEPDASIIASDIAAAVALHNGERLLSYVDANVEGMLDFIRGCLPEDVRNDVRFELPYEIPSRLPRDHSDTVVIACMDFRLHRRDAMMRALGDALGEDARGFDLFATAGGAKELHRGHPRFDFVMTQVAQTGYCRIILLSHEDCGKYGGMNAFTNSAHEMAALSGGLNDGLRVLSARLAPFSEIRCGIVRLDKDTVDGIALF